jgi:hypothetical protein
MLTVAFRSQGPMQGCDEAPQHPNRVRDVLKRHTERRRCSSLEKVRAMLLIMSSTSESPLRLILCDRDRHLVHLGATATNEELAKLVNQLKRRATLNLVEASQLGPPMTKPQSAVGLELPDNDC